MDSSVSCIKGIGKKKQQMLGQLNISTLGDLLHYFPREYSDRSQVHKIAEVENEQNANLEVEIIKGPIIRRINKKLSVLNYIGKDESGIIYLTWFNQEFVKNQIELGQHIRVTGKVKKGFGKVELHNIVYEKAEAEEKLTGKIVPIYGLTKGINNADMIKWLGTAFENYGEAVESIVPEVLRKQRKLLDYLEALKLYHFPKDRESFKEAKRTLIYEELFSTEIGMYLIKHSNQKQGIIFEKKPEVDSFIRELPFKLTKAQKRVVDEILLDMEKPLTMSRLVQGDVGSGKTIVAIIALLNAVLNNHQGALLVPTEILAKQHFEKMKNLLSSLNIELGLLVGSLTAKQKNEVYEKLESGEIQIVVGTHALMEDTVVFNRLGLVVTDEQHRFGVRQRAKIAQKGEGIDVLVMTATPIPRTLSLIVYGDLEVSIIDELPAGRKPIKTYVVGENKRADAYGFIEEQIKQGRQGFVVCPAIEQNEEIQMKSAEEVYENIKLFLPNCKIGLIHGKLNKKDKDEVMENFIQQNIDILVSTTVIEVGVDIPNASIMLVENAERFGLAQLHQLRGRIGRGGYESYCVLVNGSQSEVSKKRMEIMKTSNDGFVIAEKDMEIRGPGQILGLRQHGLPEFKVADLMRDIKVLNEIQKDCNAILAGELPVNSLEQQKIIKRIEQYFGEKFEQIIFN